MQDSAIRGGYLVLQGSTAAALSPPVKQTHHLNFSPKVKHQFFIMHFNSSQIIILMDACRVRSKGDYT